MSTSRASRAKSRRTDGVLSFSRPRLALRRVNPARLCLLGRLSRLAHERTLRRADMGSDTRGLADRVAVFVLEPDEARHGRAAAVGPFGRREGRERRVDCVEGCVEEVRDRGRRRLAQVLEEVLRPRAEAGVSRSPVARLERDTASQSLEGKEKAHLVEVETAELCRLLARVSVKDGKVALALEPGKVVHKAVRTASSSQRVSAYPRLGRRRKKSGYALFHGPAAAAVAIDADADAESTARLVHGRVLVQGLSSFGAVIRGGCQSQTRLSPGGDGESDAVRAGLTPYVSAPRADDSSVTRASPSR